MINVVNQKADDAEIGLENKAFVSFLSYLVLYDFKHLSLQLCQI